MKRSSGILLHITSLASEYGVGDLGPSAYRFADFLSRSGQRYWQILPLNPPTVIIPHCPYSALSAFAGDPLLISPQLLCRAGLLTKEQTKTHPVFPAGRVDYHLVHSYKTHLLEMAYLAFKSKKGARFEKFCDENKSWLDDYALFMALRDHFGTNFWNHWPRDLRDRKPDALEAISRQLYDEIIKQKFFQYIFFNQWTSLKNYCEHKQIKIIGDVPIYVAFDGADVWANKKFFKLNSKKNMKFISGTPPDEFCKTGQLWGNPIYDWKALKQAGFSWWLDRVTHNLSMFDMVRIDHFRGLIAYWQVPAENRTSKNGRWVRAPKESFFNKLLERFSTESIIVEDLGFITPAVYKFIEKLGLRGMKILQWGFSGDTHFNRHALKNHVKHSVVYTGTHDNNTLMGWLDVEASARQKEQVLKAIKAKSSDDETHWKLIEYAMSSRADLSIIPMQDVLALGGSGRMNTPGTVAGNWQWRLGKRQINSAVARRLGTITAKTGRA